MPIIAPKIVNSVFLSITPLFLPRASRALPTGQRGRTLPTACSLRHQKTGQLIYVLWSLARVLLLHEASIAWAI